MLMSIFCLQSSSHDACLFNTTSYTKLHSWKKTFFFYFLRKIKPIFSFIHQRSGQINCNLIFLKSCLIFHLPCHSCYQTVIHYFPCNLFNVSVQGQCPLTCQLQLNEIVILVTSLNYIYMYLQFDRKNCWTTLDHITFIDQIAWSWTIPVVWNRFRSVFYFYTS